MLEVTHPRLAVKLLGAGRALPRTPALSNLDILRRHPDTADKPEAVLAGLSQRIERTYGFSTRHLIRVPWAPPADPEESSEDLALRAVRAVADRRATRGQPAAQPGTLVLGSTSSRRYTGSQACAVLGALGSTAAAFEVKGGCSTSLLSLHLAHGLLCAGHQDVMVACAETLSKVIHPDVRETWLGLADGAAALWLGRCGAGDQPHAVVERVAAGSDGRHVDLYTVPGVLPPRAEMLAAGGYGLSGDGQALRALAFERYRELVHAVLPDAGERASVDLLITHQVNRGLTEEVVAETRLGGRLLWSAGQVGNLGGTSVLYTLAEAVEQGVLQPGMTLLMMSVGGGLSFAAQLWRVVGAP